MLGSKSLASAALAALALAGSAQASRCKASTTSAAAAPATSSVVIASTTSSAAAIPTTCTMKTDATLDDGCGFTGDPGAQFSLITYTYVSRPADCANFCQIYPNCNAFDITNEPRCDLYEVTEPSAVYTDMAGAFATNYLYSCFDCAPREIVH